ncbi:germ cell-less protein-like 1 isoform X2 [Pomacea canaliculata]|uniref:germ cell-less protein-like 1 isoform X2 n=1 Tax=Pomacea canaliculata TaxID=400727 RepID=UPI000D72F533|nr:germ cell-less protein-like 1 isoform X2 [Pomacea canaliculata]
MCLRRRGWVKALNLSRDLQQCKYFESMFSGPWIESNQSAIHMEIADENVTSEALKVVLQSLYTDNVFVKPSQATGVVAAATLLQLDPMIDHCSAVMQSAIGAETVCGFYMAAERYGLVEVKKQCQAWLQHCLMVPNFATLLCHISEHLLLSLLSSPDLWMMQVEVDVYSLLKKWVFIQMNPTWKGNREQLYKDTEEFFRTRSEGSADCFLEKSEGWRFIHIFDHVRWAYVLSDLSSIQLLKDDKIVPLSWLDPFVKFNWYHHLQVEQAADKGPQGVSEEQFLKESMRCGRILLQEQDYCWRWVGYNYGLDLLIMCRDRAISVKRNSGCQSFEGSISQQQQRHVMVRVNVAPIRKKDNSPSIKTTGIKSVTLGPNEEAVLLQLGTTIRFPLQVTMNLMFFSPSPEAPTPSLAVPPLSASSPEEYLSVAEDMPTSASGGTLSEMLAVQLGLTKPCTCDGIGRPGIFSGSGQESIRETPRREGGGITEACDLRQHGEVYVQCGEELDTPLSRVGPISDRNTFCSSSSSGTFSSRDSDQSSSQSVPVSSTLLEAEIRATAASPILDASNNSHSHRTVTSSSCHLCS